METVGFRRAPPREGARTLNAFGRAAGIAALLGIMTAVGMALFAGCGRDIIILPTSPGASGDVNQNSNTITIGGGRPTPTPTASPTPTVTP